MRTNESSPDLTPSETFFVFGEYIFFISTILTLAVLLIVRRIRIQWFACFTIGFFFGCIWEITHYILGDTFLTLVNINIYKYIPRLLYPILHASADAVMFLLGLALTVKIAIPKCFKKSRHLTTQGVLTVYPFFCLLIMMFFYMTQEIIFELIGNNYIWIYSTNVTWNPVVFTVHGVGYTIVPFAEWLSFGFLYWVSTLFVFSSSPCRSCTKHARTTGFLDMDFSYAIV